MEGAVLICESSMQHAALLVRNSVCEYPCSCMERFTPAQCEDNTLRKRRQGTGQRRPVSCSAAGQL
eukprot:4082844-Pleurochrysis_carterae.AAC.1